MGFFEILYDFISGETFSIPLGQVIMFVILNSIALLLGRYKLGLLVSYCFVFYWGFIFNRGYFIDLLGNTSWGLVLYAFSGLAMPILALIGFFRSSR